VLDSKENVLVFGRNGSNLPQKQLWMTVTARLQASFVDTYPTITKGHCILQNGNHQAVENSGPKPKTKPIPQDCAPIRVMKGPQDRHLHGIQGHSPSLSGLKQLL
jgi:hypothetical protein